MRQSKLLINLTRLTIMAFLTSFPLVSCYDSDEPVFDPAPNSTAKVILDTDMVEGFDDGIALMMLLKAENVDLLGVTTVSGNTWAQEGLAYAVRQWEIAGGKDMPLISGSDYPMRENRLATIRDEVNANPGKDNDWLGCYENEKVTSWNTHYQSTYKETSTYAVPKLDASDFIIQQILANPGEVTLVAIGPCTNIAKALVKAPQIASMSKAIIYMGGAFECEGNTTPYAEFNILFDPEAAAICFRADFPRQTVFSLDACESVIMDKARYMDMYDKIKDGRLKEIFAHSFHYDRFLKDPSHTTPVWDVLSAAAAIDPSVIIEGKQGRIDVDDTPSSKTYGKTFISESPDRRTGIIPLKINETTLWHLVYKSLGISL